MLPYCPALLPAYCVMHCRCYTFDKSLMVMMLSIWLYILCLLLHLLWCLLLDLCLWFVCGLLSCDFDREDQTVAVTATAAVARCHHNHYQHCSPIYTV